MAKKFLDYSGLSRFLAKIKSWANGAFAVKSVNGVDLHSMVVDKTNNATFGSMSGKNIQQLRDAIDMWHAENAGKENASLKFSANNNFIDLWNSDNLTDTLSSGTTWTLTATNNITTNYSTFQLSTYSNGHELYTIKKLNGVWQSIEKVAKNKSISKSASNKGVSVALGGTVESPTISVTTTTSGVTSNNTGVVSGAEVKTYVDANKGVNTVFKAQTSSSNAVNGLVPAPISENTTKFLRGDGTWQTPSVAEKLGTSDVGSTKKPIYLQGGSAKPCTYELNKSVPSDAVFTDTHYTAKNIVSNSAGGIETAAASNGEVHINLVENGTWRSGINISGSGATLVTSDKYGNITITSEDTTYVAMKGATSSTDGASGLVPKPLKTQQEYLLRGDGTWTNRFTEFGPTGSVNIGSNYSNAIGWFRIVKSRHARSRPSAFRLILTRGYSTAVPECYVFDVVTSHHAYDPISITQVAGQASSIDGNKLIEKIRVVRDESANGTFVYLDFYVGVEKTGNTCYWSVEGNATSLVGSEVIYNPELSDTDRVFEFDTVNGFKTNGDIEGDSRFRSKMRSNPQTSSGVMFDTAPMLINGFIPYTNTEIVEAPSGDTSLFGISYLNTSYGNYTSNEIFYLTPGEKIKVECWLRRDIGADKYVDANGVTKTRTKGTFYMGMRFKDKKGHYVNSNAGTVYFNGMSAYQCPCDGKWHHLEAEYTIPETHTPYIIRDQETNEIISQSDGGGYYTGTIRSMINFPVSNVNGNTPTYLAGIRITRMESFETVKWGGSLNTAAYATDYPAGTVLKVNTSESLYVLQGTALVSKSVALGTKLIVSHESYTSGTSNTSGKVFVEF